MAQSSVLSLPFVFWTKAHADLRHDITVAVDWESGLVTGSPSGELIFWQFLPPSYQPRIVSSPSNGLTCLSLGVLLPPFHLALSTSTWVVSLHSDNRLRIWDPQDGRCISISPRTMFTWCSLTLMKVIHRRLLAISGDDMTVNLVDAWSMTKLSSYTCPMNVIGLETDTKGDLGLLVSLSEGNMLSIWTFSDLSTFLIDPMHMQIAKDCIPISSGKIDAIGQLSHVEVMGDLIFLCSHDTMHVLHYQWISSTHRKTVFPVCIRMDSRIKDVKKVEREDEVWVVLETGEVAVVGGSGVRGVGQLEGPEEFVILASQELDWIHIRKPALQLPILIGHNSVFQFETNTVKAISPPSSLFTPSPNPSLSTVSLSLNSSLPSEPDLLPYLSPTEVLTDSHLALSFAWPIYLVGTSLGRIFAVSLSYTTEVVCFDAGRKAGITALMVLGSEEVLAATEDGWLQTWKLRMVERGNGMCQHQESTLHVVTHPSHLFPTHSLHISKICSLTDLSLDFSQPHRSEDWCLWQHRALLQSSDHSISLISLETESVLWQFIFGFEEITEVRLHLGMDYMILQGNEGTCYVISLSTHQLERICPAAEVKWHAFTRLQTISQVQEKVRGSLSHQMLDFHLSSYVTQTERNLTWTEYPCVAGVQLPLLCLHIGNIRQAYEGLVGFPDQAEFLISLLNTWKGDQENLLPQSISSVLELKTPSIRVSPGTFGVEDAISFVLPTVGSPWQVSPYLSAVLSMSLMSVLDACSQFKPSLKVAIRELTEGHVTELITKVPSLIKPSLLVLSYEVLTGDQTAYTLFRSIARSESVDTRSQMRSGWRQVVKSSVSDIDRDNTGIGTIDVLSVLNLTILSDSAEDYITSDETSHIVWTVKGMLRSSDPGLQRAAVLIISDEIKTWYKRLSPDLIEALIKVLLRLQGESQLKHLARSTLLAVGKYCIQTFFRTLREEVVKMEKGRDYPNMVLGILEAFLHKYSARTSSLLPDAISIILNSLNPKASSLRPICLDKATDVLELMVKQLPMVAFEPRKQRLAVGTTTHEIWIYDLKHATVWKKFRGHGGPVSAVGFSGNGGLLASYCAFDLSLKCWKLDSGFLGLGNGSVKPIRKLSLDSLHSPRSIDSLQGNSRLRWCKEGVVEVTREDGCPYQYEL